MKMVKALIISHGNFARESLSAVEGIIGKVRDAAVISNHGLSLEGIRNRITEELPAAGEAVVFVDVFGSNYAAAKAAAKGYPVICGFNLAILISFFTKREKLPLQALMETVIADGKKSIRADIPRIESS